MKDHLARLFFGNDIFIAFSRRDAAKYADALHEQLTARGFLCYPPKGFDLRPSAELPHALSHALRRSRMLLLLLSREASSSPSVEQEVQQYLQTHRTICVIRLDEDLEDSRLLRLVQGLPMVIDHEEAGTKQGKPSFEVLGYVKGSFTKLPARRLFTIVSSSVAAVLLTGVAVASQVWHRYAAIAPPATAVRPPAVPDVVKSECQHLVEGQLLFEPTTFMRQGRPDIIFARLARKGNANITEGLQGSSFVIVAESISCKVSMSLDSEEPGAFIIQEIPAGRKAEQLIEGEKYTQWDWRGTPRKHGVLHLLLFVTPVLYIDGVGEALRYVRQPPRVITVTPDYYYEVTSFVKENWLVIGGSLGVIIVPLFLWSLKLASGWLKSRFGKKKQYGF